MPRGRMEPEADINTANPAVSQMQDEDWGGSDEWNSDWAASSEFGDDFVQDEHPVTPALEPPVVPAEDTEATAVIPVVAPEATEWTSNDPLPIAPDPYPGPEAGHWRNEPPRGAAEFDSSADPYHYDEPEPDSRFPTDAYLRTPQKPTRSAAGKQRSRRIVGGLVAGIAVVAVGAVVAINGSGKSDTDTTASVAKTTAAVTSTSSAPSTVASAPGPGDTKTGPGVILGFDDAYYIKRNGAAAADFLVPSQNNPATAAAIQTDIDRLDPGIKHSIVVTSTGAENVYNVKLGLTTPDGVTHDYHQQYTVVSTSGRFYIANKLNCDSVCPTP